MFLDNRLIVSVRTGVKRLSDSEIFLTGILVLSLITVTYFSFASLWYGNVLLAALLLLGLVRPILLRQSVFWGVVAVTLFLLHSYHWHFNDNHKWLFMLWAATIAVALTYRDTSAILATLRRNGLWLLVLVMLFSVVQKTLDPTYLNGSFFAYTMVVDERFLFSSAALGGLSEDTMYDNIEAVQELLRDPLQQTARISTNAAIVWFAYVTTAWVWLIELAIGVFLLLRPKVIQQIGHILHLLFLVVTYVVAPVYGFGLLLTVIGLLLTHQTYPRLFRWYLAVLCYLAVLFVVSNLRWYL
jgi:hypothetical protein